MKLAEIIVVISVIVLIVGVVASSYSNFLGGQRLNAAVSGTVSIIQKARGQTLSSKDETGLTTGQQYGVRISIKPTNKLERFRGTSYVSANVEETFPMPGSVDLESVAGLSGGNTDIIFKRLTGEAQEPGTPPTTLASIVTITLKSQKSGNQKTVIITPAGIIQTQ